MSQALRKLTAVLNKSGCSCIFINQLREKIGIVFGNPETTTGGRALKFYSSIRLEIKRGEILKEGDVAIGQEIKIKVVKNKVAPPYKTCVFDLVYGKGISHVSTVVDLAIQEDIIKKSGSWYSYEDNKIGQGLDNAKKFLSDSPEILKKIEIMIREKYHINGGSSNEKKNENRSGNS